MDAFISNAVTSSVELFRYYIIRYIDTGDKTLDNLLIGFVMMIMTSFSSFISSGKVKEMLYKTKRPKSKALDQVLYRNYVNDYFRNITADKTGRSELITLNSAIWFNDGADESEDENEDSKPVNLTAEQEKQKMANIMKNIADIYSVMYCGGAYSFTHDGEVNSNLACVNLTMMQVNVPLNLPSVVYTKNDHFVFVSKNPYATIVDNESVNYFTLHTTDLATFQEFIKSMNTYNPADKGPLTSLKIFSDGATDILHADRNMSIYVSKYKKRIITMLDNFIRNNKSGGRSLGGYGSYNLGMMLHGEPGTGKTLLMKVIANYLHRNIRIIDMRKIKTRTAFKNIFSELNNVVYILDEIDCIKGIISNRSDTTDDSDTSTANSIKQLQDRYLKLLQIEPGYNHGDEQNSSQNSSQNNSQNSSQNITFHTTQIQQQQTPIQKELESILKQIDDLENALTLDTILTVLDGVVEHRGRVIIAATNHIDKIDPALIRDGRFDLKIKLERFTSEETRELLGIMFKDDPANDLKRLANANLIGDTYTPAQIVNIASSALTLADTLDILEIKQKKKRV